MMSSADSMMLVVTSSVGRDIYQKVIKAKEEVREDVLVRLNRVVVVAVVVVCLLLTFFMEKSALMIALFAYGGLGGALGPVVILSLWWKRMTKWGALAGLLGGIGMAVGWHFTPSLIAIIAFEALPAFMFSMVVAVLVSLATKPPRDPELESDLRFPSPGEESQNTTALP
jgi:Na+/proline symporter